MGSSINASLATLPPELLMMTTLYLDLEEYVNLRASCTRLCMSLKSDDVCGAYVKVLLRIIDRMQMLGLISVELHELYIRSRSRTEIADRLQHRHTTCLPYQKEVAASETVFRDRPWP